MAFKFRRKSSGLTLLNVKKSLFPGREKLDQPSSGFPDSPIYQERLCDFPSDRPQAFSHRQIVGRTDGHRRFRIFVFCLRRLLGFPFRFGRKQQRRKAGYQQTSGVLLHIGQCLIQFLCLYRAGCFQPGFVGPQFLQWGLLLVVHSPFRFSCHRWR